MNVLITAIGSMSADAVIGSLRSFADKVVGCDIHPAAWLPSARGVSRFYQVSFATAPDYMKEIESICLKEEITHLVPLTDLEVDVFSPLRSRLKNLGVILCISAADSISKCRDKWLLHKCVKDNFPVIPTLKLVEWSQWDNIFPLLAKPCSGRSRVGHFHLKNPCDARYLVKAVSQPYIVQPLLSGSIFTVDVVRNGHSGKSVAVAREELIRTANGAGLTIKIIPEGAVCLMANKICNFLNINGCVNMEFIGTENEFLLMDINPRFSAGVAFSQASGYDMVKNHMRCFSGLEIEDKIPAVEVIMAKNFQEVSLSV